MGSSVDDQPVTIGACAGDILVGELDSVAAAASDSANSAAFVVEYDEVGKGEEVATASPAAADDHGGRGCAEKCLVVRRAHDDVAVRLRVLQLPHNLKHLARLPRSRVAGALDAAGLPEWVAVVRKLCCSLST